MGLTDGLLWRGGTVYVIKHTDSWSFKSTQNVEHSNAFFGIAQFFARKDQPLPQ